jgi:hypothetical protein
VKKLTKACSTYEKWKVKNQPSFKPWLYPEQMTSVRLNPTDIGTFNAEEMSRDSIENSEATIGENVVAIDDFVRDD